MLDRIEAGEDIKPEEVDDLEEEVRVVCKRSTSEEAEENEKYKRCKVTVTEEEMDGVTYLAIQDD
jgi:hypothetical protein